MIETETAGDNPEAVYIWTQHMPISVNKAYRNKTSKDNKKATGRIRTQDYMTWLNAFGWDCNRAMRGHSRIDGAYSMHLVIDMTKRHKLADLSNFIKVVEDALQHHGVIEDDRFAERMTVEWGNPAGGTSITVTPC